ncbi:MAG: toxic anion resistance protein, partial [Erysipelotrichaceae bacterium]|nr:toxic anion resistance protein [Erysipelotrichaceae bacterium]
EDSQKANDYANLINRFEKKLHDLELTRMISIQMAPQIRLIQNNDTLMAEKIQSTLVNTIPLWKSQMVIALGLSHSQDAIAAEQAVDKMTNELLKKNAEALKQGTIATAEASERGIVELETLQFTNKSLIETLDEVLKIQTEGRQRRTAAEVELRKLEAELREKLLEVKKIS